MLLYFAGAESLYAQMKGVSNAHMLFSYYNLGRSKDISFIEEDGRKYFLDSGAFSAFTQGINVDIDEYIDFIKATRNKWEVVNGLDVIGDWKASAINMEKFEANGIDPLPTFHTGSPLEELRRMCQKYDYIALGGLVPYATKSEMIRSWLSTCFSVIKDYWPKKIHGFGVNSVGLWTDYPFYSVDATSWLVVSRKLAQLQVFKDGKMIRYGGLGKLKVFDERLLSENPDMLLKYKDDGETNQANIDRGQQQMREFMKAADYVTNVWKERGIVFS